MVEGGFEEQKRRRHLIQDPARMSDVELKHDRVRQFLTSTGADALLLQDPANIAWFAAGADVSRYCSENSQSSLFVTEDARLFATNAVDATQIFEREAFGLGFQLKQREWFQPHSALVDDLSRGRRVVSDSGAEGTKGAARRIARMRLPLTRLEVIRLRKLSRVLVHAVEVTAGNLQAGMTEAAVAGEVSHRLVKRTVTPVRIQVCADGRNDRFRHWGYGEDQIESFAIISCVARRWGLHVAVSRTVAVDKVPSDLLQAHQQSALVHCSGMFFSRNGEVLRDVWPKVRRIYEKFGHANEWPLADQADVLGYRTSEVQLTPDSDFELSAPVAMYWHPSIGPAMHGDSILITAHGCERLTHSDIWPQLTITVKGQQVLCPGILRSGKADGTASADREQSVLQSEAAFSSLNFGEESDTGRIDSAWELELTSERSIFDDEDDAAFSEESVLD